VADVANLSNLPTIPTNWITAAGINADAITSAKIADNALANEHFAAGALTATEITGAAGCAVSSIGANVVTAASIAAAAIDNATFAADVGSTAYATNIIALAVRKALDELNLDHLLKIAVAGTDVVDNTLWADLVSKEVTSDYDDYDNTTDSLQAIRDHATTIKTVVDAGATTIELDKVPKSDGTVTWNATALGSVNAQADLALSDINLDHFVGTASGIPALPAGTYLDLLQDDGTAVYSRTTDSLQAIRDHATTVKTDTAAIKTETDKLTFTVANQVDANIQYINDAVVTGDGTSGTEWDSGAP
jgi:methylmalonyl-CoA mutase cobalamin-binding subunit